MNTEVQLALEEERILTCHLFLLFIIIKHE